MIVAFPSLNGGLDDMLAPNFGRAPTFTLVTIDDSTKDVVDTRVVQNPNAGLPRAAGIQTASYLASLGVNVVVVPSVGPNAYGVLVQAGIKVYLGSGRIGELVEAVVSGSLKEFDPGTQGYGSGRGFGPGFGRGPGRGRGIGRGMW